MQQQVIWDWICLVCFDCLPGIQKGGKMSKSKRVPLSERKLIRGRAFFGAGALPRLLLTIRVLRPIIEKVVSLPECQRVVAIK